MRLILLALLVSVAFAAPRVATQTQPPLRQRMLAAEDARVPTDAGIAPLLEGLRSGDESIVLRAVRGLGRFERPAFIRRLIPLLSDARPAVRREAAFAIGQSLASVANASVANTVPRAPEGSAPAELATATRALHTRLRIERDAAVAVTIAETLGRLPHRTAAAVREAEQAIRPWLTQPAAFRGIEALIRLNQKLQRPEAATLDALRTAAILPGDSPDAIVTRRLAWLAVNAAGAVDMPLIRRGAADGDPQVRRQVAAALGTVKAPGTDVRDLLLRALKDPSFNVRIEAVRVYARTHQAGDCGPPIAATEDANLHVAIAAIDVLGGGCPAGPNPRMRLAVLADTLTRWQPAAHALLALAKVSPEDALKRLPKFAEHQLSFIRAYAARAAVILNAAPVLERLAVDVNDNVRHDALIGLKTLRGHGADGVFIEALGRRDYQLVLAAAQALEGTPARAAAVPALVHTFNRLTAERRDTSRDTRMAVLARLRELGTAAYGQALQSCLTDVDPVVAAECSATLQHWTGVRRTPKPTVPFAEPIVEPMAERARIVLRGGRAFEMALLADEAPASVIRFSTLARAGYYNGLTFHRVLPNFIVQGGSPGANEYAGDGPFMRDEITMRTHARGTVGVSTRGRDTGDAQFFVNLLDNPRLDRDYTIFADVIAGMDVVDAVAEGDVIERIEILAAPAAAR